VYAVQYVMPGSTEQLRGLANYSALVWNVSWMARRSVGGWTIGLPVCTFDPGG
jgi:hypothetical protein